MIRAPFNFVPLSDKVFFPPWADRVNHDVPFKDGESGVIDITVKAKSPIFIRDGKHKEEFCHFVDENGDKQYYIPGSSIKGMIRNILEIMTFSKMSFIDDNTYSVRDLHNKELYRDEMKPSNIYCGWLKKDGENYIIEDCGKPGRIKYDDLGDDFKRHFLYNRSSLNRIKLDKLKYKFKLSDENKKLSDNDLKLLLINSLNIGLNDFKKTAKYKYDIVNDSFLKEKKFKFSHTDVLRDVYKIDNNGSKIGKIVFTGHPAARFENKINPDVKLKDKKTSGKIYDFVFFEKQKDIHIGKENDKIMKNFLFAYFDGRTTEPKESPDWTFWKKKLNQGKKVPVFFQKDKAGNVKHFGLSYLYKLPYKHSVKYGLSSEHKSDKLDMAQLIFGYIDENEKEALKGRVQFSHLKTAKDKDVEELPLKRGVLGTPRASYYPIYIKQTGENYKTYMDDNFVLSGWKRYPIHKDIKTYPLPKDNNGNVNEKVLTSFKPLNKGVIFKGKIRFHNLRKVEIGALLSALTFYNKDMCFHNLGMAKPLGYGKVKIDVTFENKDYYIKEFHNLINAFTNENIGADWEKSEQIQDLFKMAQENENENLTYMQLKNPENRNKNDFTEAKQKKEYLKPYSQTFRPVQEELI